MTTAPSRTARDTTDAALAAVSPDRALETLAALVRLPSVNPFGAPPGDDEGEERVADYIEERARRLGMEVERTSLGDGRCNLRATWPGADPDAPHLVLAAHMDTVRVDSYDDPFSGASADGRLSGRGACDTKASIAASLEALEALHASKARLRGRLTFLGVADEEYEMLGAQRAGADGPIADAIIVGEPTGMRSCTASKGRVSTFIVTHGRAAHSSQPEGGVNAIVHMARIVRLLEEHADHLRESGPSHPLLGTPRLNQGMIDGGVQVNMVPPRCALEIDRRTLPHESLGTVNAELEELMRRATEVIPDLAWEITEPSWLIPPYELEPGHPLLDHLAAALREAGGDPTPQGFVGGSDAAHFRTPAVICGPGDIEQAHTDDEWVAVPQLELAVETYLRTALSYLGVDAPAS